MENYFKRKYIDIPSIRWGQAPAPLLPKTLRIAFEHESLPNWVCAELGLTVGSTLGNLGASAWNVVTEASPRLKHFLTFKIRSGLDSIGSLKCFDRKWPLGLKLSDVGWAKRTLNCVSNGTLSVENDLEKITFGYLSNLQGMGTTSIIDFCATLEGVMDFYNKLVVDYATKTKNFTNRNQLDDSHQLFLTEQENVDENTTATHDLVNSLEHAAETEWAEQISEQDPRFRNYLPPGRGTIQERIEAILLEPDSLSNLKSIPLLHNSLKRIQEHVSHLQLAPLEESLRDLLTLLLKADQRRVDALAARLGWLGEEPATLDVCGKRLGVTRERMRQIQEKLIKRIPTHAVYMPKLDQAITLLENLAPIAVADASRKLADEEISTGMFHPAGVLEAARLFGKQTTLDIIESRRGEKTVVNRSEAKLLKLIPGLARRLAGKSGISNVFQLQEAVRDKRVDVNEAQILQNLQTGSFEFLNDDWFWATDLKDSRNRLYNVTRKILSVASPQNVMTLRDGVRRLYHWRFLTQARYKVLVVPPAQILLEFYRRHPAFQVEGDNVLSADTLDCRRELGVTDSVFYDVLRSSPSGLLDRDSLAAACMARGMNENTFNTYSCYSPILEHVDVSIWKLRGMKVDPSAVEAMRIANQLRPKQKRVLEFGWGEDGKLWVAARVPASTGHMILGCPVAIQRYLVGMQFNCVAKDGNQNCGTVTVNDRGISYGYGTFIRRYGLDENDILFVEFDINEQTATLSIADEEMLGWN